MNVLAIGAHPDDLDILCGGTLLRFAKMGAKVEMRIVTDGRGHPLGDPAAIAARRLLEAQRSADLIGANLECMGFQDGRLVDDVPTRLKFIETIMKVQPDLIITHPPADYHSDHNMTSRLVTATVQMAWAPPPELAHVGDPVRKQVPVAYMVAAYGINFLPEDFVDITDVWETKLQMALHHRSQYLPGPDWDAIELQEPLDQYSFARFTRIVDEFYGQQCWCRYAEGFAWWRAADRLVARRLLP
jgi:LmbE family N-acetylglucosaminyl deacetylase